MSTRAPIRSVLLSLAALAVAAAPAAAAPAVTPVKRTLTAAPGARVSVRLAVRDVTRCAVTVAHRTKGVRVAGRPQATFSFRLGRRARAGVYSVRVTCPPARARTVRLSVRRTAANRKAAGPVVAGPITATAEAASAPSTAAPATPAASPVAVPAAPKPAAATPATSKPAASKPATSRPAAPATPKPTPPMPVLPDPLAGSPPDTQDANATPYAAFATRHGAGTLTTLDAGASRGTGLAYRWTVDGVAGPSGAVASIRPTVGVHRVRLDVTDGDGHTTHVERNVAISWRGTPFTAQNDVANGNPGDGLYLPELITALDVGGPWRTFDCLNNGYAYRPYGDTVALTVHQGDHPGTTGGDRCALGINEAITPYVDVNGNTDGLPRFYHVEFMLDPSTAGDLHAVFNNLMEWHGRAGGGSVLKLGLNGPGTRWAVYYTKMLQGVTQPSLAIGDRPVERGVWQDLTVEARWSADPQVGYVRVFWGGVCVTCGMPQADSQGRIFGETLKQLADGRFEKMAFAVQNYRQKFDRQVTGAPAGTVEPLPDTTVWYRKVGIGPTLGSAAGAS